MLTGLTEIERRQLRDKYTAHELVDVLCLDVCEVIDAFELEIEDALSELLDESRGIGL